MAINTTFDFGTLTNENLSLDDFTYITTTAGSQTGVLARADSGWKTLEDVAAAAAGGTKIVWSNWGALVQAGSDMVSDKLGFQANHLQLKGGKATLNALVAKDANLAWGGGIQRGLVAAGEVVILASAEDKPLVQAPGTKTLADYGIKHKLGFQFIVVGPKNMDSAAREAIATAIAEIMNDPKSKTAQFVTKQYPPGPVVVSGKALEQSLRANLAANKSIVW